MKAKLLFFILLVFIAISCKDDPVTPPPPPPPPDSTSHNFIWEIDTVGYWQSRARGVWATDIDNIWVVGLFYSTPDFNKGSNIAHWDGEKWIFYENIWENYLYSCFGFDSSDVWAVGMGEILKARICHWDGTNWAVNKYSNISELYGIWGASTNSIYAVGLNGTIIHYDGSGWRRMNSGTSLALIDIWGTSDTDIYACGGDESQGLGILLHYDGTSWKKIYERTYQPGIPSGFTSSIWGYSEEDYYLNSGARQFFGYDTTWTFILPPTDNTYIESIRGESKYNFFIIGHFGLAIHWNGKSWYRYEEFFRKPAGDLLRDVWCGEKEAVIVGTSEDNRGIVYRGKMIY